jgi:hypothetical protein
MSRYGKDSDEARRDIERARKVVEDGVVSEDRFQAVLFGFLRNEIDADPLEADA